MLTRGRAAGGRRAGLLALCGLLVLAGWSVLALQPPAAAPVDAPAGQFSATRAFAHVERIAGGTHVTGSPANDRVRTHLLRTLDELGLDPQVQDTVGTRSVAQGDAELARVRNVVAVLPGTDPTGRLFLVAHADSVETGPGGNDDAAGVSTILETVRALNAGPRLRNDVVVVLTDAEEACLCGAEAFVAQSPLAAEGGVVLNMEARGTGGPPIMFETSPGNAALAGVFAAAAPHPVGTSFAVEVYRALPNDTDFSPFLESGRFTGLNTAYIDGEAAYHTPEDTPSRMNRGSLQAMGDNTLALTRALGDADLDGLSQPAGSDAVYFPVLDGLLRVPGWLVWPVAGLGLVGVGALALVGRRVGGGSLRRSIAGVVLAAVPLVLAPLAAQALWALLVAVRPGYASMIDPWRPGWYRGAVVALVLAVVLAWYVLLRRRVGALPLAVGGLSWLAALGLVLAALAPGGSYLVAVPVLAAALAGVVAVTSHRPAVRLAARLLGAAVAVLVLVPTIALFFPALGLAVAAVPAVFTALLALALLPVVELVLPVVAAPADGRRRRGAVVAVPATAAGLAAVLVGVGLAVDRFDAAHPLPTQLMYALDADTGTARWVSTESDPGEWTGRYVSRTEHLGDTFPVFGKPVATGPALAADLPAPELTVDAVGRAGGGRELTLAVQPRRPARLVVVEVTGGGAVTAARVAGQDLPAQALGGDSLRFSFHGSPGEGVRATVVVDGNGPVTVRALDGTDGLTGLPGFDGRPAGVGLAGTHTSDLVVVATSRRLP